MDAPGDGYSCQLRVHPDYLGVEVIDQDGFVCHQAVYYPPLDALQAPRVAGMAPEA